jgi:hypothetical protein
LPEAFARVWSDEGLPEAKDNPQATSEALRNLVLDISAASLKPALDDVAREQPASSEFSHLVDSNLTSLVLRQQTSIFFLK